MHTEDALCSLVEFNLATYEALCGRKRRPSGELDRIEAVLLPLFDGGDSSVTLRNYALKDSRLAEVFETAKQRHWGSEEALYAFFNAHRHGTIARKFVLQDDAKRYWPKNGVTMLPSDVKDAMVFPSRKVAEAKQAEIFGRSKRGPRVWKVIEVE